MQPRNEIDDKYNNDPRHIKQWEMTIEWLKQFRINKSGLDCGDKSKMTIMLAKEFKIPMGVTSHDLDYPLMEQGYYHNIFMFEVIEHLLNSLVFMEWAGRNLVDGGIMYLSTPINRPN
ncbi:hypothetical protein LCGC14_2649870, partial [marine sediment metagenome]